MSRWPLWLIALLGSHLQRLLRESMVRRALGFPVILVGLTLALTLLVVGVFRGPSVVAHSDPLPLAQQAALAEAGFAIRQVDDPKAEIAAGRAVLGLTSERWWSAGSRWSIQAESVLRRAEGAPWWPTPPPLPTATESAAQGSVMASLILAIYSLYGVVFGAGMVARDRDQGTLEAELSLPIPSWLHGLSRWLAASLILGLWMVLGVAFVTALVGTPEPWSLARIGTAGALGSVAIGLGAVGRSGLQTGFAATLASGLSAATGLFGIGYALPAIGAWLPLASILTGGEGWGALLTSALMGVAAVGLFAWRTARP